MTVDPGRRRLLIWDVHGTVADSFATIEATVDRALSALGHPLADQELLRSSVGEGLPALFARLVDGAVDQPGIDALVAIYRVAFGAAARTYATLFPGVEALLGDLAERDAWSVAVTGDSTAGLQALLEWLGIAGGFGMVLSDEDVAHDRPHPEIVLAACQAWGCAPTQTLVVAASAPGLEMGRRAGAQTCGVTWGTQNRLQLAAQRPTWLVDSVDELRHVLAPELAELDAGTW